MKMLRAPKENKCLNQDHKQLGRRQSLQASAQQASAILQHLTEVTSSTVHTTGHQLHG